MNKKNVIKFILDTVMVLMMVLLFNKRVISMSYHEISGLIIFALFVVHIGLNYKWVIAITKKFFSKDLKLKTRIGYIVNFLLLLSMGFIGISGILISKTVLRGIASDNIFWKIGHQSVAGFALILIGIHIGLHWPFIKGMAKRVIRVPGKIQKPLGIVCLVILVATGVYNMGTTSFTRWLSMPFKVAANAQGGHDLQKPNGESGSPNKEKPGRGEGGQQEGRGQYEGKGGFRGQTSNTIDLVKIVQVIISFLSIAATFATWTVWIEMITNYMKKAKGQKNKPLS